MIERVIAKREGALGKQKANVNVTKDGKIISCNCNSYATAT